MEFEKILGVGGWASSTGLGILIRRCSSSRKLVILFVVIAAAVIVLGLEDTASVVCSIALPKGFKLFM